MYRVEKTTFETNKIKGLTEVIKKNLSNISNSLKNALLFRVEPKGLIGKDGRMDLRTQ